MHKIWLIVQREYLTRVRKKSFIIMTLLGPLLMAAFIIVPAWLSTISDDTETVKVLDESGLFTHRLKSEGDLEFQEIHGSLNDAKQQVLADKHTSLLYIPKMDINAPEGIQLFSTSNSSLTTKRDLQEILNREIENLKLTASGIDKATLDKIKADVDINTVVLSDVGEKKNNTEVTTAAAFVAAFLMYMFIFIYGVQIMRGVIEEKTNRIVEIMISSVKPFQLMMGKILGIAAVGLTQFLLWIILSTAVTSFVASQFKDGQIPGKKMEQMKEMREKAAPAKPAIENPVTSALETLNVPLILGAFLFYFLGGYLLYGALFGAVGSAVDNETDTQQFMLPITIPLIMSFVVAQTVIIKNPDGPVAFWMSVIPFTSPISMMLRLPFGVPGWQLALSMVLLVLGFIFTVWLAARIYRVGILMYGKKVNYRELSKWLFYKG